MGIIVDQSEAQEIFKGYVDEGYLNKEEDPKKKEKLEDKYNHSLFVMDEALAVDALFTKYSPNYKNLLTIESLFHDIGRFEQMRVTGTYIDSEMPQFYPGTGLADHGDLGAKVIAEHGLLEKLIPDVRTLDAEVQRVIRDHSKVTGNELNKYLLEYLKVFSRYDLAEIFGSNKTANEVAALGKINTAIVQDVDRLDIFRKIVKGIWTPATTADAIDPELWELFKQGKLPTMAQIKADGKWNANVGHLVRLSFISQMNLVPVLVKIREEGLIDKIYKTTGENGPHVQEAYEIAKEEIDRKIAESEDGMIIRR